MADSIRIDSKMLRSSTKKHKHLQVAQAGKTAAAIEDKAVASHAMFSGTIHLVNLKFRRTDQGGSIVAVSDLDYATALAYMNLACPTILHYTSQYGPAAAEISPVILNGTVDIGSSKYNQTDLENWIHTIAVNNGISSNDCLVVLNPTNMVDTDDSLAAGVGGYHSRIASCRYIFVNLTGAGLTIADEQLMFAPALSHEMAEMIVDPDPLANPEVCDPCAGNCGHVTLNFFLRDGSFVGSVTDADLLTNFDFFVEGVVQPAYVHSCPAPFPACAYFPEIWTRLGGGGYRSIAAATYSDNRMGLFALGSNRDAWHVDQTQAGGSWGAWQSFGAHDLQTVTVASNQDKRLEVFGLGGDKSIYHLWQSGPAGAWGQWVSLGGDGGENFDVSQDGTGTLHVFAIRSGGECVHIQQSGPNGNWGNWNSLGGSGFKSVQAGVGLNNQLIAIVLNGYNILYGTTDFQNASWARIGGPLVSQFTVITDDSGALHVAGITTDKTAVHIAQQYVGVQFAASEDLAGTDLQSIWPALNADGRLEVYSLGGDNKVYHRWKTTAGTWGAWAGLGATQDVTFKQVIAMRTPEKTIMAFGLLADGTPAEISQTTPNGGWA